MRASPRLSLLILHRGIMQPPRRRSPRAWHRLPTSVRRHPAEAAGAGGGAAAGNPSAGGGAGGSQVLTVRGLSSGTMMSSESVRELAKRLLDYQRDGGQVGLALPGTSP